MGFFSKQIYSHRTCLRKLKESDLPLVVKWSKSPAASGEFLTPENYNLAELEQKLQCGALWNDNEKHFIVELKESGRPIGMVHYWQWPERQDTVAISLKITEVQERGKGYGTEIQKIFIMYLFDHTQTKELEMYTDINNISQQRCLQKLGFELVESLTYDDQQKKRTGHLFRLTRQEYKISPVYRYPDE